MSKVIQGTSEDTNRNTNGNFQRSECNPGLAFASFSR